MATTSNKRPAQKALRSYRAAAAALAAQTTATARVKKVPAAPKPTPAPRKRTPTVVLSYANHGGGCCGMSHVSGFGGTVVNQWYASGNKTGQQRRDDYVSDLLNDLKTLTAKRSGRKTGCAEVVITDSQMMQDNFQHHKLLLEAGYTRVGRFLNSNSSNYCNVYLGPYGQPAEPRRDPLLDFNEGE